MIFTKNAEVLEAVRPGKVDMAFTNASASRAEQMDFGPPYLNIERGYLAAKDPRSCRCQVSTAGSSGSA